MNNTEIVNQEKHVSEALKIARECKALCIGMSWIKKAQIVALLFIAAGEGVSIFAQKFFNPNSVIYEVSTVAGVHFTQSGSDIKWVLSPGYRFSSSGFELLLPIEAGVRLDNEVKKVDNASLKMGYEIRYLFKNEKCWFGAGNRVSLYADTYRELDNLIQFTFRLSTGIRLGFELNYIIPFNHNHANIWCCSAVITAPLR